MPLQLLADLQELIAADCVPAAQLQEDHQPHAEPRHPTRTRPRRHGHGHLRSLSRHLPGKPEIPKKENDHASVTSCVYKERITLDKHQRMHEAIR